jgi:hypothetical protein
MGLESSLTPICPEKGGNELIRNERVQRRLGLPNGIEVVFCFIDQLRRIANIQTCEEPRDI